MLKCCIYIISFLFSLQAFAQDSIATLNTAIANSFEDSTTANEDSLIYAVPYFIPDSILQLMDTSLATAIWQESPPSVFTANQAGRILANPAKKQPRWLFIVLLLQMLALVYIKKTDRKNMEDSLKAYFNINLSQQLFREQENTISLSMLIQTVNYFLTTTIMIYLITDYFFKIDNAISLKIATIIFLFVLIIYFLKYIGYRFISNIFPFSDEVDLFRFNFFLNQKLIGIILIPFIYAATYIPNPYSLYFLVITVALFILSIIIRSFKGIVIGAAFLQKHTFHFLLYICTFEIAPVLILIKWLQTTGYGQN